ncbi:MAG: hypothetical protein ACOY90_02110 [Candidatus Zhuqueibacterota bacterium]
MKSTTVKNFVNVAVFALALSCFNPFAPKLEDAGETDLIITEQRSPDEVLQNFKYSYVFKDSVLYSNILDSSFVFIYFDPTIESSGRFVSWGRDVDLKTTGRLFRNFDVIDLIWNSTIYQFDEEDRSEVSKSFNLSLIKNDETLNITGNAIFIFRKSAYDNKWRIVQWKDESDL